MLRLEAGSQVRYTKRISEYVEGVRYSDLPPEVIERAKMITLNTIGAAISVATIFAAAKTERIARQISGGAGKATAWTSGETMSPMAAAFLNGTAADLLSWTDCAWTGHPSSSMIPAAMAVAEAQDCSGREYLEAVVAAFEAYQRIAMSVRTGEELSSRGEDDTAPGQIFASALAAAKIYGFSAEQIEQTLGSAVLFHKMPSRFPQRAESEGSHYEQGFSAISGMLAAYCAKEGISHLEDCFDLPGVYQEQMSDKVDRSWLLRDLGARYYIMDMLIKRWPADTWIQAPLEMTLDLVRENDLSPEDIETILIDPPTQGRMSYRPEGYESRSEAQASIPYVIAVALSIKHPGSDWYLPERFRDPRILALAARVRGTDRPPASLQQSLLAFQCGGFPAKQVEIIMKDGRVFREMRAFHKGHPNCMLTREEFKALFLAQTRETLTSSQAERIFQAVFDLERVDHMSELGALLRTDAR